MPLLTEHTQQESKKHIALLGGRHAARQSETHCERATAVQSSGSPLAELQLLGCVLRNKKDNCSSVFICTAQWLKLDCKQRERGSNGGTFKDAFQLPFRTGTGSVSCWAQALRTHHLFKCGLLQKQPVSTLVLPLTWAPGSKPLILSLSCPSQIHLSRKSSEAAPTTAHI